LTLYLCHCTECQKQASSAFGMSLWVRRADLEIVSGEPKIWTRPGASGGTVSCAFCPACGSRLYHDASNDPEIVSVKAGSLDDTSWLRPAGHIWTRSRQPWVDISDAPAGLVFETEPSDFDVFIGRWAEEHPAS
jgi:hypothetical protein